MLRGSCACGKVRYEIRGALHGPVSHCHCWRCRKQSGASFGTTVEISTTTFTVLVGQHFIRNWRSAPGTEHFFASCCGSPVYRRDQDQPGMLSLPLGTLDSDPHISGSIHVSSGSKAPWLTLAEDLAQDRSGPPFGVRE